MNLDVPMWQLTAGQLVELTGFNHMSEVINQPKPEKKFIYALLDHIELQGCGHQIAQRIKGIMQISLTQVGQKIIFNAYVVLNALNKKGASARG